MSAIEQDSEKVITALKADIDLLRATIDRIMEVRISPRAIRQLRDKCYERLDGPAFVPSDPHS